MTKKKSPAKGTKKKVAKKSTKKKAAKKKTSKKKVSKKSPKKSSKKSPPAKAEPVAEEAIDLDGIELAPELQAEVAAAQEQEDERQRKRREKEERRRAEEQRVQKVAQEKEERRRRRREHRGDQASEINVVPMKGGKIGDDLVVPLDGAASWKLRALRETVLRIQAPMKEAIKRELAAQFNVMLQKAVSGNPEAIAAQKAYAEAVNEIADMAERANPGFSVEKIFEEDGQVAMKYNPANVGKNRIPIVGGSGG